MCNDWGMLRAPDAAAAAASGLRKIKWMRVEGYRPVVAKGGGGRDRSTRCFFSGVEKDVCVCVCVAGLGLVGGWYNEF